MHISTWKSKGLSDESIRPPPTFDNSLAPSLNYIIARPRVKSDGQCFKQDKVAFTHKNVVNIYNFSVSRNSLLGQKFFIWSWFCVWYWI